MTDVYYDFRWPRACISCGSTDDANLQGQSFRMLGGMSTHRIGRKRYRNDYHYIRGTAYLCPSCLSAAETHASGHVPKVKNMSTLLIILGIALIPINIWLGQVLTGAGTSIPLMGYLYVGGLVGVVVICTLGMSTSEEGTHFDEMGPAYLYVGYKHSGVRKDLLKSSSRRFAQIFTGANPMANVKVGKTMSRMPLKRPSTDDCLVGCCVPLFIIFLVSGILMG
jgi:hypothetical protein